MPTLAKKENELIDSCDYLRQRKLGVRPVFDPLRYPEIGRQLSPDAWDDVSQE